MIAVIADDLTGAAELAGIGVRHGLDTEISTAGAIPTDAGLLVIAADTRSMGEKAAVAEMARIARQLRSLQPDWVYKKVDSVLRGHVLAELHVHLLEAGIAGSLLIPENPSMGRIIRDGHYYVQGRPVSETSFSDDPEFPITCSDVRVMLGADVDVRKRGEPIPSNGIIVGEAATDGDLEWWAASIVGEQLPAGAAGFFAALLAVRGKFVNPARGERRSRARGENDDRVQGDNKDFPAFGAPVLFVTGTTFIDNRELAHRALRAGGPVRFFGTTGWVGEVSALLRDGGKAIVAIESGDEWTGAAWMRAAMAEGVCRVLQRAPVRELVIEGGATAYAIIRRMGMDRLHPVEELAPGVVRMRAGEIFITVKPGSYRWPETIKYLP